MSYPFIQATYLTPGRQGRIDVVVIHVLDAAGHHDGAAALARRFAGPNAPEASVHYCADEDSIVQCVRDDDVAWHSPGANHDGLGVALTGGSAQTLARGAELVAAKCVQYGIPPVWLYPADLLADRRGITGHWNVALAHRRSDHVDRDLSFPSELFVDLVRRRLAARVRGRPEGAGRWGVSPGGQLKDPPPTQRAGDTGWRVRRLQRLLQARGLPVDLTDELDAQTLQAVLELQRVEGLRTDGVVGPATWRAVAAGGAQVAAAAV